MADLTAQVVDVDGLAPAYAAADAAGDRFVLAPGGRGVAIVHVRNGDASQHTVTLVDQTSVAPPGAVAFDANVAVAVPAGEDRFILATRRFAASDGWVSLTWSAVTGMTVAVLRPE